MSTQSEAEAARSRVDIPRTSPAEASGSASLAPEDLSTRQGFELFVLDCQERVFRFLLRKGVPAQDALELRQDAFLTLWENRSKPRNPRTFLMGVANRLAMAYHRKSVRVPTVSLDEVAPQLPAVSSTERDSGSDQQEASRQLNGPLAALTNRQRQVIELVWLQSLSRADAAERLGITQGALRYHEKMGLDRLRAALHSQAERGSPGQTPVALYV